VRCGAVAAQRLAVAMEHERTYLLARTSGETTARPPVFSAVPSKCTHHGSRLPRFLTVRD
jgi:hypothetical protein